MPLSILFWVLMLLWLVFGMFLARIEGQPWTYRNWGGNLLIFILLFLLGWQVFGAAIK